MLDLKKYIALTLIVIATFISCISKSTHKPTLKKNGVVTPKCMYSLIGKTVEYKSVNGVYPMVDSLIHIVQGLDSNCKSKFDSVSTIIFNTDSVDYHIWITDSLKVNNLLDFNFRLISIRSDTTKLKLLSSW